VWPGRNLLAFRSDLLPLLSEWPIIWWQEFLEKNKAPYNLQYGYLLTAYNLRLSDIKENYYNKTN